MLAIVMREFYSRARPGKLSAAVLLAAELGDVAVVLFEGLGESMAAGAVGDVLLLNAYRRAAAKWRAARPGLSYWRLRRQALVEIGVVGESFAQLGPGQRVIERVLALRSRICDGRYPACSFMSRVQPVMKTPATWAVPPASPSPSRLSRPSSTASPPVPSADLVARAAHSPPSSPSSRSSSASAAPGRVSP